MKSLHHLDGAFVDLFTIFSYVALYFRWFVWLSLSCCSFESLGTHLRAPALKTENFSKIIGRFSKMRKWIYKNAPVLVFPGFSVQRTVLVNPLLRFTKTTDFFTKIHGFKGKGS